MCFTESVSGSTPLVPDPADVNGGLAQELILKEAPFSSGFVVIDHGFIQHGRAASGEKHFPSCHLYLISDHFQLKDVIAFAQANSVGLAL